MKNKSFSQSFLKGTEGDLAIPFRLRSWVRRETRPKKRRRSKVFLKRKVFYRGTELVGADSRGHGRNQFRSKKLEERKEKKKGGSSGGVQILYKDVLIPRAKRIA